MNTKNVPRYAYMFEILCMILMPVVLIIPPLLWFFGDNLTDATYGLHLANFSFWQRALGVCVDTIGNMFLIYGLMLLIRIARKFRHNEIFTAATASMFLRLRTVAGAWALYNIVYVLLFPLVLTTTFPTLLLVSSVLSTMLVYSFIYVFVSILAMLITKATELQGDQDLTV